MPTPAEQSPRRRLRGGSLWTPEMAEAVRRWNPEEGHPDEGDAEFYARDSFDVIGGPEDHE